MYLSRSSFPESDWRAGEPLTSNALTKAALYYVVAPSSIPRDDVAQKLALQDLFKELSVLKEQTMKCHSETTPFDALILRFTSPLSYWKPLSTSRALRHPLGLKS